MRCEDCFIFYTKRQQQTPCERCSKPVLAEANYSAWEIFSIMIPQGRYAGLGGLASIDLTALPIAYDLYQVPDDERYVMFLKLNAAFTAVVGMWNAQEAARQASAKKSLK